MKRSYLTGESVLQSLIGVHRHLCVNHIFDAADHVERAMYAFRKQEHDEFKAELDAADRGRDA